ncbi:E3 ubiquitin-protein ligase RFWD3 isoform X3 [Drosophila rhopaloa]|nr:E3 ubiquitin-protein ligase RFWD3 isoform X3 [Drosophila rhopaloa]
MAQNATIGENLIISDLRAGVNGLNQRLDRMSQDITCSICLTPWTGDQGRHHLVSLRCGHLFGSNCIHTAIRRYHRCPICRRRARHNDVRRIYGRSFLPP